jgi:hypothetical protein
MTQIYGGIKSMLKNFSRCIFEVIFWGAVAFSLILIVISLLYQIPLFNNKLHFLNINKIEYITWGVGLLTAIVIFYQLLLLKKQMAGQTFMDFTKQWNAPDMVLKRKKAMEVLKLDDVENKMVNLDDLESVLELLEDFSTFKKHGVLDQELVWDSAIGWYAIRYFHYSYQNKSIDKIRTRWCEPPRNDKTYYQNLEEFYKAYLKNEVSHRKEAERKGAGYKKVSEEDIKEDYNFTKQDFIRSEETKL